MRRYALFRRERREAAAEIRAAREARREERAREVADALRNHLILRAALRRWQAALAAARKRSRQAEGIDRWQRQRRRRTLRSTFRRWLAGISARRAQLCALAAMERRVVVGGRLQGMIGVAKAAVEWRTRQKRRWLQLWMYRAAVEAKLEYFAERRAGSLLRWGLRSWAFSVARAKWKRRSLAAAAVALYRRFLARRSIMCWRRAVEAATELRLKLQHAEFYRRRLMLGAALYRLRDYARRQKHGRAAWCFFASRVVARMFPAWRVVATRLAYRRRRCAELLRRGDSRLLRSMLRAFADGTRTARVERLAAAEEAAWDRERALLAAAASQQRKQQREGHYDFQHARQRCAARWRATRAAAITGIKAGHHPAPKQLHTPPPMLSPTPQQHTRRQPRPLPDEVRAILRYDVNPPLPPAPCRARLSPSRPVRLLTAPQCP